MRGCQQLKKKPLLWISWAKGFRAHLVPTSTKLQNILYGSYNPAVQIRLNLGMANSPSFYWFAQSWTHLSLLYIYTIFLACFIVPPSNGGNVPKNTVKPMLDTDDTSN
jgi:hypothetical protein